MVSQTEAAKYPVFRGVQQHVGNTMIEDFILPRNQHIVDRALMRIKQSLVSFEIGPPNEELEEFLSFPIAMMYVMKIKDRYLSSRYAHAEAIRMYDYLRKEGEGKLIQVAGEQFDWDVQTLSQEEIDTEIGFSGRTFDLKVYFVNYIDGTKRFHEGEWKLGNRILKRGYVYVTQQQLARLLENIITDVLMTKLTEKMDIQMPQELQDRIPEIMEVLVRVKPDMGSDMPERVDENRYPPCIKNMMKKLRAGINLSHNERFALTTFLINIGMNVDDIMELYENNSPDYRKDITEYQVNFLRGKDEEIRYSPPACKALKTQGLCIADCHVFHPLDYYKRK